MNIFERKCKYWWPWCPSWYLLCKHASYTMITFGAGSIFVLIWGVLFIFPLGKNNSHITRINQWINFSIAKFFQFSFRLEVWTQGKPLLLASEPDRIHWRKENSLGTFTNYFWAWLNEDGESRNLSGRSDQDYGENKMVPELLHP